MESEKIFYVVATRTTLFTVALIAYVWWGCGYEPR
jgi:hypothetical protein